MSEEFTPQINVIASPVKVSRGQMLSITANIFDKYTMVPMAFDTIFMEIIDEKGIEVWPLSLVEEESAGFSKLISTSELDAGKKYTIRVSPSRKLRPIGTAEFEIDARLIEPAFLVPGIALIPEILLIAYPDSKRKEKSRSDVIGPDAPPFKIAWLIYRTEKDSRVCPLCRPHEGERYRPNDPNLPMISIHKNCRCHYNIISVEEEKEIYQAMKLYYDHQEKLEVIDIYQSYLVSTSYWNSN